MMEDRFEEEQSRENGMPEQEVTEEVNDPETPDGTAEEAEEAVTDADERNAAPGEGASGDTAADPDAEPAAETTEAEPAAEAAEAETAAEAAEADERNAEAEEEVSEDTAPEASRSADPEQEGAAPADDTGLNADEGEPEAGNKFQQVLQGLRRGFCAWKTWQKALAIVLVVVLLLAAAAYGYFHSKYILMDISDGVTVNSEEISDEVTEEDNEELLSRLESGELEETEAIEATGEVYSDEQVFNILLIGTDDRTVEFSDNARGDTCILLSINMETGKINLVSFERATGVKIPSGDYEGQWDWLTHTFWYGGADMMMSVIRDNFKVDVTKYVRVNIRTYMKLVDAVGGVDIDMTEAEVDNINHPEGTYTADHIKALGVEDEVQQDLVVGVNHLNGATAMLYARLRSIDSDWYRVVRQRKVLMAAFENLKSMSLTEIDSFLDEVLPMVQTNLTEADIAALMTQIPAFLDMEFESITFPLQNTYGLMSGMAGRRVLAVDFETNAQELQNLLYGETTAEELEEKYDSIEGYSYRNSASYQANYADAESQAGSGSSSSASSAAETDDEEVGEDAAADIRTFDTYVDGTDSEIEGGTSSGTAPAASDGSYDAAQRTLDDSYDAAQGTSDDTYDAASETSDTSLSTDTGSFLSDAFVAAE